MPKSKRSRVVHMTNVTKKNREHKERLFDSVRESLGTYQHCFVFGVDNMRNTHLKEVRQDLSDSRFVLPFPPSPITLHCIALHYTTSLLGPSAGGIGLT